MQRAAKYQAARLRILFFKLYKADQRL